MSHHGKCVFSQNSCTFQVGEKQILFFTKNTLTYFTFIILLKYNWHRIILIFVKEIWGNGSFQHTKPLRNMAEWKMIQILPLFDKDSDVDTSSTKRKEVLGSKKREQKEVFLPMNRCFQPGKQKTPVSTLLENLVHKVEGLQDMEKGKQAVVEEKK